MKIDVQKMHSIGFGVLFFPRYGIGIQIGRRWFGIKK
jgi:hypothetical protein